jgi:hypothetical protein
MKVLLHRVAHARAGDKGNTSNVAVIAYDQAFFPHLVEQLTPEAVLRHYGGAVEGPIDRYEVERLGVLNFVMSGALGGGVSRTLAIDNFGKTLGAALLGIEVVIPDDLVGLLRGPDSQ